MIVFVRTKNETETLAEKLRARGFSAAAINGDVAQAQRERTVNQLQGRQARHPRRHRRRGPRPRRRADQPRRQLRHPDRHRVLRAPHRPHRPRRPQRRRDLVRHPARALPAQRTSRRPPASRSTQMQLPTVEDVNATRLARFDDAITAGAAARPTRIDVFRDSSATTCSEHDVPEVDVAAALAVVAQGDAAAAARPRAPSAPTARAARASAPTATAASAEPRRRAVAQRQPMATYRIAVGKRHKVEPRQIVGALANEGGLSRGDFGAHRRSGRTSRSSSSPPTCSPGTLDRLAGHPHLRQADRAPARQRPVPRPPRRRSRRQGRRLQGQEPPLSGHFLALSDRSACGPSRRSLSPRNAPSRRILCEDAPARRLWTRHRSARSVTVRRSGSRRRRTRA